MNKNDLGTSDGTTKAIDMVKTYRLKPLPLDTPLETIIELVNGMELFLYPLNKSDVAEFIIKHPELVEEVVWK